MKLTSKAILIISPQQWEGLKLSKHHYAEELSRLGNNVYFLPPPDKNLKKITVEKLDNGINLIKHGHRFPYKLFFHSRKFYFFLLKSHIKNIINSIEPLDVVWSFDGLRFLDLNLFKAKFKIYHPVDIQSDEFYKNPAESSDITISLTDKILQHFSGFKNIHKVGHGVSENFLKTYDEDYILSDSLNFCYAGNLTMHGVDFSEIMKVIESHSKVKFHFIGPYDKSTKENESYVSFLEERENVFLYGLLESNKMQGIYKEMDGFLLCYDQEKEQNGGTNSHKILEYLSTGKVVVSSPIVEYLSAPGVLEMSVETSFHETFFNVTENIKELNSKKNMLYRHNFAKDNTYKNQILKIEQIITSHK